MKDFIEGCQLLLATDPKFMTYAGHDIIMIAGSLGEFEEWPEEVSTKLDELGFFWNDSGWSFYT